MPIQVKTAHEVSGRKFSLRTLREHHLNRMKRLGVVRELDVDQMSHADVVTFLQEHGKPTNIKHHPCINFIS